MVDEFIDRGASLKEVTDHLRCGKVIVHGIVALLTQGLYHLFRLSITFV